MGHDGVKRSNIVKTELAECTLQDLNSSLFRRLVGGGRIDGLDNFVYLGGHQRIWQGQLWEI